MQLYSRTYRRRRRRRRRDRSRSPQREKRRAAAAAAARAPRVSQKLPLKVAVQMRRAAGTLHPPSLVPPPTPRCHFVSAWKALVSAPMRCDNNVLVSSVQLVVWFHFGSIGDSQILAHTYSNRIAKHCCKTIGN